MSRILNIFSYKLGHSFGRTSNPEDAKRIPGGKLSLSVFSRPVERAPETKLQADERQGRERAAELFEAAYDEHARRLAKLYENLGHSKDEKLP